jgi:hypothetical protein
MPVSDVHAPISCIANACINIPGKKFCCAGIRMSHHNDINFIARILFTVSINVSPLLTEEEKLKNL